MKKIYIIIANTHGATQRILSPDLGAQFCIGHIHAKLRTESKHRRENAYS